MPRPRPSSTLARLSRAWASLTASGSQQAESATPPALPPPPTAVELSGHGPLQPAQLDPTVSVLQSSPKAAEPEPSTKRIIYDIGSNNGDDIPYYLLKADLVVAAEANPSLAIRIQERFSQEISAGRLRIENCVVTVESSGVDVPFYIHGHDVLSQFEKPAAHELHLFDEVRLPSRRLVDIVAQHGQPHYMKVDVEGYDYRLLMSLFRGGIYPTLISAESHSVDVFAALVAVGGYTAFKLVDGPSVQDVYRQYEILTQNGPITYSFPHHSAGPFGDDIKGDWQAPNEFLHTLAGAGLGWKDVHATARGSVAG